MFRLDCLLSTIILLSVSSALALDKDRPAPESIRLGYANLAVVSIDVAEKRVMAPGVVVRVRGQKSSVESYGVSNEGGMILMPLPPGQYCYDAFTYDGNSLELLRKGSGRCFSIERNSEETIGVEFRSNAIPSK